MVEEQSAQRRECLIDQVDEVKLTTRRGPMVDCNVHTHECSGCPYGERNGNWSCRGVAIGECLSQSRSPQMLLLKHASCQSGRALNDLSHCQRTDLVALIRLDEDVDGTPQRLPVILFDGPGPQGICKLCDLRVDGIEDCVFLRAKVAKEGASGNACCGGQIVDGHIVEAIAKH
jgi:hypothetical protein